MTPLEHLTEQLMRAELSCNVALATKWRREINMMDFSMLANLEIDPQIFADVPVYACQKIRKLVDRYAGKGSVDPYTRILVNNAIAADNHRLSAHQMMCALDDSIVAREYITLRRKSSPGTAQAQLSSSKAALLALGMISLEKEERGHAMILIPNHPIVGYV